MSIINDDIIYRNLLSIQSGTLKIAPPKGIIDQEKQRILDGGHRIDLESTGPKEVLNERMCAVLDGCPDSLKEKINATISTPFFRKINEVKIRRV